MVYRNWRAYQDALTNYKEAKAQHDRAVEQWNEHLKSFDKDSLQAESVQGLGCVSVFVAGIIIMAQGMAGSHWVWGIPWFFALGFYQLMDEKVRKVQKRKFIASTPNPIFTLLEPVYQPPEERNEPPPRSSHQAPPSRGTSNLTLEAALGVLGLNRSAKLDDVKRAYRERIREYHPDKVAHLGSELRELAERKAKEINAAYELLLRTYPNRSEA